MDDANAKAVIAAALIQSGNVDLHDVKYSAGSDWRTFPQLLRLKLLTDAIYGLLTGPAEASDPG